MTTRYTEDHEWITVDGDIATVGITAFAAGQLGDVVFVELPEVGRAVTKGDEFAVVESVKAASEVYAPVDGEPAKVNEDPSGAGWFVKIKLADASQLDGLMDEAAYTAHTA